MCATRLVSLLTVMLAAGAFSAEPYVVRSPDGSCVASLSLPSVSSTGSIPMLSVSYRGDPVLLGSPLTLQLSNGESFPVGAEEVRAQTSSLNEPWKPVCGPRSEYPNHYNALTLTFDDRLRQRVGQITIRAYNEGIAFRYAFPEQKNLQSVTVTNEATEFAFPSDYACWFTAYPQGSYDRRPISKVKRGCTPLIVEAGKVFAAIAEAGSLESYAPTVLTSTATNRLAVEFRKGVATLTAPSATPWRVLLLADNPGALVEHHYLLQNINSPSAIADNSWITPGKVWRNTATTREGSDAIVDYNAAHGYQFVHWDTGWNGKEYDNIPDHPTRILEGKDLLGSIQYAHQKGQKFILYVNHRELENFDLDESFATYRKWGVDGLKFGFVNWETQAHMAWLHAAMRKAAQYKLMVVVHDNYRPSGYERTYPNLMTFEGIAGNETKDELATPRNRCILAFARTIAGPADFTPCFFDARVQSRAFQLATAVVFYSPWQYIHWYDRPDKVAQERARTPELEFWEQMPTVWDDSRVLHGEIGSHITMARRKGSAWFVSSITDRPRTINIPLNFLEPGKKYSASVYQENRENRLLTTVLQLAVDSGAVIEADMGSGGGHNLWIRPGS